MPSGSIVRQLYKQRTKETKIFQDEFQRGFPLDFFFLHWFTTLVKDSRHTWSLFGANIILAETTIIGS